MSRVTSLAVALLAVAALLATTGTATADAKRRLANVPFQTSTKLTALITPSQGPVRIYYRCTSRKGGRIVVAPHPRPNVYRAVCDGKTHSDILLVDVEAFVTGITLQQGSAARAGFSIWEV